MLKDTHHFDVIVIGGGAAGLMAAGRAAELGKRVLLLEKNKRLGEKLRISGGGRCNITNAEEDVKTLLSNYGEAEKFLYSVFSEFGIKDTFEFFESKGLPIKVEDRKRAFPLSEKAVDVVDVLVKYASKGGVEIRTATPVRKIILSEGKISRIVISGGEYTADSYVLATGGLSHPETGSTGDGFLWLEELGHTVVEPTPTIVPLKTKDAWIKSLRGKTLTGGKITFYLDGKKKFTQSGNILLTHFGLSGPTILNCAGKVADLLYEGKVTAKIDLFPTLDVGSLDTKIQEHFNEHKNKTLRNVMRDFLPAGTADGILALVSNLDKEKKVHSVTKEERRALVDTFKELPVNITGLMGFERAVVADGGVPLTEIDTRTMRSLKDPKLFIIGDLLHIKRPSGGYSLQLCWTMGYVAGSNV